MAACAGKGVGGGGGVIAAEEPVGSPGLEGVSNQGRPAGGGMPGINSVGM